MVTIGCLWTGVLIPITPGYAQQVITQREALSLAVPGAAWERRTAYLSDDDLAAIALAAGSGVEVTRPVVTYYVASIGGRDTAVAYFDVHRVRTLAEVLMVVVDPAGRVERVEILKFSEPPEYRAPAGWLVQFQGKLLDDQLSLKGGVVAMSGASLTSRAVTHAVRRVLAIHRFLEPMPPPAGEDGP